MSQRTRVEKLKRGTASGFVVAWHKYLSADGERIKWASEMDEDAVHVIEVNGLCVEREECEAFSEFNERVTQEANKRLNVTVWLHPAVADV